MTATTTVTGWLLDTHALLWMLHGDKRLSKNAAQVIDGKLPLHHSSASFWEIAIKLSGKGFDFQITDDWNRLYPDELKRIGVPLLSPTIDDCRLLQELPRHHGDPFDRMLVCQAKRLGLGIISMDEIIDSYAVARIW
ncbi:MAG: type II toxin-antitoxin system VapC family toxin [Akkermansiaceae bacterium]|jgi:PIN domain nuclease of toxin-antitoxin system|nr:type II toxin-antitoxin system VapC family toxin [Akkermansiaceae bacterium]